MPATCVRLDHRSVGFVSHADAFPFRRGVSLKSGAVHGHDATTQRLPRFATEPGG